MTPPIILIGKQQLTVAEEDALFTLGYGLALLGSELHTTQTPGAPAAVVAGYRAGGSQPTFHTSGIGDIPGVTLCVLDDALADRLDQRVPDWMSRGWQVLHNEERIVDYVSVFVTMLDQDGIPIVSEGVAA